MTPLRTADEPGRGGDALVLPATPASYSAALERYLGKLGWDAEARVREWKAKGWLLGVANEESAFEALKRGKATFLVGNDAAGGWLGRSADNHPEGFALPGSQAQGAAWAIGRADAFSLPAGGKLAAGAADLLAYLTSKGVSRRFAEKLPGTYYYWAEAPAKGKPPLVNAPTGFVEIAY